MAGAKGTNGPAKHQIRPIGRAGDACRFGTLVAEGSAEVGDEINENKLRLERGNAIHR